MRYKDYYALLGVERDAAPEAIKRAYRVLARKYHPDVSKEPDAEERFKEVGEAYEVLKDSERRAAYDQLGSHWREGQEFRPPPGWKPRFDFGGGFGGAPFDFSDFFGAVFGQEGVGAAFSARAAGRDTRARIALSLEEAHQGVERSLEIGEGAARRALKVKIPVGVTEGQRIRLAGQGVAAAPGGPRGDLYLHISLLPHRLFRVEDRDVYLDLPVTPWEAALGATVKVPTLGGPVDLRVPAGSQSGRRLRLRGRGLGKDPRGDQHAVLQIVTPPADTPAARKLYEQMAESLPMDPRAHLFGDRATR
jgi:curved DNA-binding protein